jgi:hypothetical protein
VSTIYIIQASGGSYDDAWERNLFAVGDEAVALVAVDELKARHEKLMGLYRPIRDFFTQHMSETAPMFMYEPSPDCPKGPAKPNKEALKAHAAAIKEWTELARPIGRRNQDRSLAHNRHVAAATRELATTLGADEEDLKALCLDDSDDVVVWPNFDADTSYYYEELELR